MERSEEAVLPHEPNQSPAERAMLTRKLRAGVL